MDVVYPILSIHIAVTNSDGNVIRQITFICNLHFEETDQINYNAFVLEVKNVLKTYGRVTIHFQGVAKYSYDPSLKQRVDTVNVKFFAKDWNTFVERDEQIEALDKFIDYNVFNKLKAKRYEIKKP